MADYTDYERLEAADKRKAELKAQGYTETSKSAYGSDYTCVDCGCIVGNRPVHDKVCPGK